MLELIRERQPKLARRGIARLLSPDNGQRCYEQEEEHFEPVTPMILEDGE